MGDSAHDQWMSSVLGLDVAAHRTSMRLPESGDRKQGSAAAAKPAAAAKAKDAGPGGPTADAKPAGPAQVNGRAVLDAELPFGTLKYYADWEKDVKPLLTDANKLFLEAEAADTEAEDLATEMEALVEKLGPLDQMVEDVKKNTDRTNKLEAANAQDADIMIEHMTNTLTRIRSDVRGAAVQLKITDDDRTAASKKQRAAALLKQNEQIEANLNLFLGLVDEAIGLATSEMNPGKAASYVTKVFKIGQSFTENPFTKEAEKLQKEAEAIEEGNLAKRYQLAVDQLRAAKTQLDDEMKVFSKAARVFMARWSSAEAAYDKASKGKFRFADLTRAVELATRCVPASREVALKQFAAGKVVKLLKRIPTDKAGPWMADSREGTRILQEMDEATNIDAAAKRRQRAEHVLAELNRSYEAVREAMSA